MVWPILISVAVTPRISAASEAAGHSRIETAPSAPNALAKRIGFPSPFVDAVAPHLYLTRACHDIVADSNHYERIPHGRTGRRVMMFRNLFTALLVTISISAAHAAPRWLSLPPTPTLPKATQSGFAPVNGIKVWYAVYGRGEPVILLHGGLANAN